MLKKIFLLFKIVVIIHLFVYVINGMLTAFLFCLFNLLLFFIVDIIKNKLKYSNILQLLIYIFLFGSLIGGEVYYLYSKIWFFDIILHILSSFIISWLFIYVVKMFKSNINNILLILCIFSFSMMVASMWEITEFSIDNLFDVDMQKDTIIKEINSVLLSDDGNKVVRKTVSSMTIGDYIIDGYLDIGLYDTMEDIICAVLGSLFFIIIFKIKEASLI